MVNHTNVKLAHVVDDTPREEGGGLSKVVSFITCYTLVYPSRFSPSFLELNDTSGTLAAGRDEDALITGFDRLR